MAGRSNDDHAKALEALSAGAAAGHREPETETAPAEPVSQSPTRAATPRPIRPAAPSGSAEQPATGEPQAAKMAGPQPKRAALGRADKQIELKRTIIPLLLTMGAILALGGLVSILMSGDSLIGDNLALPLCMIALGVLILGAAAMTMLQVKSLQSQEAR